MENNKDFNKSHKDPRQGNPQEDQKEQQDKGREEKQKIQNKNWDMVQRREQAGPRSYNESTDTENIENQNTEAHREQIAGNEEKDEKEEGFQGYGKRVGDKASERQQNIDQGNPQKDKKDRQ